MNIAEMRNTACAVLENVYLGLWVLCSEWRDLAGEGLTADRHLAALRRRRDVLRREADRRTDSGDPDAATTEQDLTLLEEDLLRLEALYRSRRAKRLAALRARFPKVFGEEAR